MKKNASEKQADKTSGKSGSRFWPRLLLIAVILIIAAVVLIFTPMLHRSGRDDKNPGTCNVQRGNLTISVIESGDIKALNSVEINSKVEGRTTIISIVDEGTYITQQDVENGKILVELDSSAIKEKLTQQEITFLTAEAGYAEARETLDIRKKQNESDIQAGLMNVRFTLMDLQKYLGQNVAEKLISAVTDSDGKTAQIESLIKDPNLGGEALQKLRELDGDIHLTEQNLELANSKFEWSKKLYDKKYISFSDKEADRLDKEKKTIEKDKAKTEKYLFVRYQFPKDAEKLLSDHNEAKRELDRIQAEARSKLAQAQANLESKQATYALQKERLERLQKQLDACIIKAPAPGQVVYSSSTNEWARRRGRIIEVGGEVRERQKIISIPDTSEMKAEIKVHEAWIDKVQPDQKARIIIAAFPDRTFTGTVLKKAPLADQQNWLNPDLKVYTTDVSIEGTHDFLQTGMTAKVEIIIEELQDVINVPIQTVLNYNGKKICYVVTDKGTRRQEVGTGAFNNDFVEITAGLSQGQKVLLNPPRPTEPAATENKAKTMPM